MAVLESMLAMADDDDEEMCTICFDALANGLLKPCGHKFCENCVSQLKKRAVFLATEGVMCPHCRQPVKEFQLPGATVPSVSTTKSAWGTSAPAPIPQPVARAQPVPKPPLARQTNGPAAISALKAPTSAAVSSTQVQNPAPAPPRVSASASTSNESFSSFAGGGGGSDLWSAGGGSLQMPAPSNNSIGGFGGGSVGGGWGGSAFGGLPGLNTDSVFASGGGGLWGGGGGSGAMDSWSSRGAGVSSFDAGSNSGWDSFKMPSASTAGGFGGGGFGGGGSIGAFGVGSSSSLQQSSFGAATGSGDGGGTGSIELKIKFSDDKDMTVYTEPSDTGKRLRMKIKQMTGHPITAQRLIYHGKLIQLEDTIDGLKVTSGVVLNCFLQSTTKEDEDKALRAESPVAETQSRQLAASSSAFNMMHTASPSRSAAVGGMSTNRAGLGAIGGGGGLMSMEDDRRSDGSGAGLSQGSTGMSQSAGLSQGSTGLSQGAGLSQDDDDWEAVGKKKKPAGKGSGAVGAGGAGYGGMAAGMQAGEGKEGKTKDGKMHFFGLWVGNVHSEVVDQDELRGCFERYGELCNSRVHGVPPINILPDSSSAFVNFCRYEDADAARNALQGRTVAGTGPLRINASDLMQAYEDRLKAQGGPPAKSNSGVASSLSMASSQSFAPQPSRTVGGGASMWNAPAPTPGASVWGGGGGFGGGIANSGNTSGLTKEERERLARLEQERKDEELARQLAKQEQYEASNAFYIQQAQQRKRQAGGGGGSSSGSYGPVSGGVGGGGGGGYGDTNFMYEAGPPLGGGGMSMGSNGGAIGGGEGRGVIGGTQLLGGTSDPDRYQQRPTLMDHLPSHLRGDEPKFESQCVPAPEGFNP
jgi:hypothetical protein